MARLSTTTRNVTKHTLVILDGSYDQAYLPRVFSYDQRPWVEVATALVGAPGTARLEDSIR